MKSDLEDRRRTSTVTLAVGGMTCASCAARIEKQLNRIDGVHATVNFATEQVSIDRPDDVTTDALVATVEATGYSASVATADEPTHEHPDDPYGRRLLVSAALSAPVLMLSMVTPLQFANWQWVAFALATPVVAWGALPFHRIAFAGLRHRAATMDTVISVGVLAAYLWSTWVLLAGASQHLYLEVAAVVTTLVLAGRYFEARAKRQSGAALHALLDMGAKDVAVVRDGTEVRVPIAELAVGATFIVAPWRDGGDGRRGRDGLVGGRRRNGHRRIGTRRGRTRRRCHRCDHERRWRTSCPGHQGRRRHPTRPDGAARRGRAERQGRRTAASGSGVSGIRPDRDRARPGDARRLASRRRCAEHGLHRRRRSP